MDGGSPRPRHGRGDERVGEQGPTVLGTPHAFSQSAWPDQHPAGGPQNAVNTHRPLPDGASISSLPAPHLE